MHIPDGYLDATTCAATGVIAAGALAWALRTPDTGADDRRLPLAGMAAATVFALQLCNFPVATGTSGHLLGGALTATLVGPRLGVLCLSVVVGVQALLFADGGLSAIGANATNLAVVGVLGAFVVLRLLRPVLPRTRTGVLVAVGVAAALTPAFGAGAFVVEYALGGNGVAPIGTVAMAMLGVHLLIGIGEAAITVLVVSTVIGVRPDLVHAAAHLPLSAGCPVPATEPAVAAGSAAR
jgi:cobalt/nickel transport system permease protein